MKRNLIILFLIIATAGSVIAEGLYSRVFVSRFQNCIPYSASYTTDDGVIVQRFVLGWRNQMCRYKETEKIGGKTSGIFCNFTRPQLDELTAGMKADEPEERVKRNGITFKSANSDKLWAKYKQNVNVCVPLLEN